MIRSNYIVDYVPCGLRYREVKRGALVVYAPKGGYNAVTYSYREFWV